MNQILGNISSNLVAVDNNLTFVSLSFFALFLVFYLFFIAIKAAGKTAEHVYLVCFSLFFAYKGGGLWFVLPAVTVVSWMLTRTIASMKGSGLWLLWLTVALSLCPLVVLRYIHNDVLMPIGLSFYTLQSVSYSVDVYRQKNGKATLNADIQQVSLVDYAFYLTFFPLLLAGPITRADVLVGNHREAKRKKAALINNGGELVSKGLWLIVVGLLKKVVIADTIGQYTDAVFLMPKAFCGFETVAGVYAYSLQIFFDFSAYSDMAIGLAALMGYQLPANFRQPYQASSLTQFWRRWHISLSSWLRDYVYIPLGGNRTSLARQSANIMTTMMIAAIWHGSTLTFAIWGALHAIALIVEKTFRQFAGKKNFSTIQKLLAWMLTFCFVTFAWIFFRSSSLNCAKEIIVQMFSSSSWQQIATATTQRWQLFAVMVAASLLLIPRQHHLSQIATMFHRMPFMLKLIILTAALQIAIAMSRTSIMPFIYSQF